MKRAKQLQAKRRSQEGKGNVVEASAGIVTAFPKNPPAQGIAYSKNFARALQSGNFAVQVRD